MPAQHLTASDLDVEGSCFGIKFSPGGSPEGLCDLYIEDDETWHYKCTFNRFWLTDLSQVVSNAELKLRAKDKAEEPQEAA